MNNNTKVPGYTIEFYKTFWLQEWRWRVKADNGKKVAAASEGFKNRLDCLANARITMSALQMFFTNEDKQAEGNTNS